MIPALETFFAQPLIQRYQEDPMTCNKPNCKSSTSSIYNSDYTEIDASPMATQQKKWMESPSTFFQRDCALHPEAAHCVCSEV